MQCLNQLSYHLALLYKQYSFTEMKHIQSLKYNRLSSFAGSYSVQELWEVCFWSKIIRVLIITCVAFEVVLPVIYEAYCFLGCDTI